MQEEIKAFKIRVREQGRDVEVSSVRSERYRQALLKEREHTRRLRQAGDALLAYAPEEAVLRWKIAKETKP